jgi:hypothetical protein
VGYDFGNTAIARFASLDHGLKSVPLFSLRATGCRAANHSGAIIVVLRFTIDHQYDESGPRAILTKADRDAGRFEL